MSILVVQLARFGDIYQTWPVLKALLRDSPDDEIHVLVRQRYRSALDGLDPRLRIHVLPTADILQPILEDGDELVAAQRLEFFLSSLTSTAFDKIINLSFSPVSSYLTDFVASSSTQVCGYTRHQDGYLAIPDDSSAYFYAQGGVGRANRYHLIDIFAAVAGVDLTEQDFTCYAKGERLNQIAVHLGASQQEKAYPAELWREVLLLLRSRFSGSIIIIGSSDEKALADRVCEGLPGIDNRVGQSSLADLMSLLAESRLLLGADSAPMQICNLTRTPVLNLSCAAVNFWETGPRASGSRILFAQEIFELSPTQVAEEALAMLDGTQTARPVIVRKDILGEFEELNLRSDTFQWRLIQALYTSTSFPEWPDDNTLGFQRLFELAELALEHLAHWGDRRDLASRVLANIDDLLIEIPGLEPRLQPVLSWFQTERLRIPPGSDEQIFQRTRQQFEDLLWVCAVYRKFGTAREEIRKSIGLCQKCAPLFREFQAGGTQADFQALLSTFHELSRHSTMVGHRTWSSVLTDLDCALERRDFIEVADQLEHILVPSLQKLL